MTKREREMENALRTAVENCALAGVPKQNWGQFIDLVANALQVPHDSAEISRWSKMHQEGLSNSVPGVLKDTAVGKTVRERIAALDEEDEDGKYAIEIVREEALAFWEKLCDAIDLPQYPERISGTIEGGIEFIWYNIDSGKLQFVVNFWPKWSNSGGCSVENWARVEYWAHGKCLDFDAFVSNFRQSLL